MTSVYARLVSLLGQPPDGCLFHQFVAEVDIEPAVETIRYTFHELGVTLIATGQFFDLVIIDINTPLTRQGIMTCYKGDLPNFIAVTDGPKEVECKIGTHPVKSERAKRSSSDIYELSPFILMFEFSNDSNQLESLAVGSLSTPLWAGDAAHRDARTS